LDSTKILLKTFYGKSKTEGYVERTMMKYWNFTWNNLQNLNNFFLLL
jgi:hypothetical protein